MPKSRVKFTSTVDVKALFPYVTSHPFAELEYNPADKKLNLWVGRGYDNCEAKWECSVHQSCRFAFAVPGIPYRFILVSGTIYYRKNVG